MERNAFLINKKIHQYILPGVLMTVAMQLGNVVDGMIVGNLLGAEAMAAIEISMTPAEYGVHRLAGSRAVSIGIFCTVHTNPSGTCFYAPCRK